MKRLIPFVMVAWVCASVSFGNFDITISNTYEGGTTFLESQSLLITGGGANIIEANGSSYIEVQNTATPLQQGSAGIYALDLDDTSNLNFFNGALGGFYIYEDAQAVFSGGSIGFLHSYQDSDLLKHITFICDVDSVSLAGNLLTGDWLDGKGSFSITLVNQPNYDSVYSNIHFVPEPATLVLFALGGLLLRRRK